MSLLLLNTGSSLSGSTPPDPGGSGPTPPGPTPPGPGRSGTTIADQPVSSPWGPYGNFILGYPYAMDSIDNAPRMRFGTAAGFMSPYTCTIDAITWDNRYGSGYSAGTGGDYIVYLIGADAQGEPDTSNILAQTARMRSMTSKPKWQTNEFLTPYEYNAFERIFVYWKNVHSDPTRNYVSGNHSVYFDKLTGSQALGGPWIGDDLPIYVFTSHRSFVKNKRHAGVCELRTTNGFSFGPAPTFCSGAWKWQIGGSKRVRMFCSAIEPVDFQASRVFARFWRLSGSGDLTVEVRRGSDRTLLYSNVMDASLLVQATYRSGTPLLWAGPSPFSFRFEAGESYSIELSAPAGTVYQTSPMQIGALRNRSEAQIRAGDTETGMAVNSDRFLNAIAQASANNGASWSGVVPGSSRFNRKDLGLALYFDKG